MFELPPPSEVACLAEAMFFEARDQGDAGMVYVAMNVLNRTRIQHRGASTICEVVYSPAQYSYLWDDVPDVVVKSEWKIAMKVHEMAFELATLYYSNSLPEYTLGDCRNGTTHYHRYDIDADWVGPNGSMEVNCGRYGDHVFYVGR